jgi:polygalacturonase
MKKISFLLLAVVVLAACHNHSHHSSPLLFNVKDFGAVGNKDNCTEAVQKAIDAAHAAGGGQVYFPAGEYVTGTIVIKSHVFLHVEAGATLYASRNKADFPPNLFAVKKNDSGKKDGLTPVHIYAKDAVNIGIMGKGTIHGQAERVYEDLKETDGFIEEETEIAKQAGVEMKMYYKVEPYTCSIFLESCKNVQITDVSIIESEDWTLHTKWCENVFIRGIYLFSDLEKGVNADGIDIDGSRNVTISDCIVITGDDAIVLKTTQTDGIAKPTENVTINNCVLESTSTALKLGTESFADFRQITFSNCVIRNTNRGLSIVVRDGANVENVMFNNITLETDRKHFNWWGNGDAIWLVVKKRRDNSKIGSIKNVTFSNILAKSQGTSKIQGFPARSETIQNITFHNVQLKMVAEDKTDKRATHAFQVTDAQNITFKDVTVKWATDTTEPKWQSALATQNVQNLLLDNFQARQGLLGSSNAAITLSATQKVRLRNCIAAEGTNSFVELKAGTSQVKSHYNDLSAAQKAFALADGVSPKQLEIK